MAISLLTATALFGCSGESGRLDAGGAVARKPIGHLGSFRGKVTLEREGKSRPGELGYVFVGDAIETGPSSEAKVRFPGGRVVEVGADARFEISEGEGGLVLKVDRGLVLSRVPQESISSIDLEGARVALSILTPFGLTRVGGGKNEVSVDVAKDGVKVDVLIGSVEFLSRNGKVANANAGDKLTAGTGDATVTGRELVLETVSATIFVSTGKAEIRRKDSKDWKLVGKVAEAFGEGDSLRVKDGRSVMQLAGSQSQFSFGRGAVAELAKTVRAGDIEESRFELRKGELNASLSTGKKSRVVVGGLELESDLGGQFTLMKTADGFDVSMLTGDYRLTRGGATVLGKAGQLARLGKGAPTVTDVVREDVVLPSRVGFKVFHPAIGRAALSWEGELKDYQVEVASDLAFTQRLLSGVVHQNFVNVAVPNRGVLFWKVVDPLTGKEIDRGSASFSPEPPAKELGRVHNDVPEGTDKTTIFYQDKPPGVTFTFKVEPGAVKYRLLVYRDDALDRPVAERLVNEVRAPLEAGVLTEGRYVWSVTPLSEKGEELRGGKMSKLDLVYDNAVPSLVIKSPKNGELIQGSTVDVEGIAPVGSRLSVNGRPVPLDVKARFETTATPFGRPPVVIFRLLQSSEAEVITVRTLRRGK